MHSNNNSCQEEDLNLQLTDSATYIAERNGMLCKDRKVVNSWKIIHPKGIPSANANAEGKGNLSPFTD